MSDVSVDGEDRFVLEKLARRSCTECGSTHLIWATVAEEADRRSAAGQDARGWLGQLALDMGPIFGPQLLGAAAWRCLDCGAVRVYSSFREDDTAAPPPEGSR